MHCMTGRGHSCCARAHLATDQDIAGRSRRTAASDPSASRAHVTRRVRVRGSRSPGLDHWDRAAGARDPSLARPVGLLTAHGQQHASRGRGGSCELGPGRAHSREQAYGAMAMQLVILRYSIVCYVTAGLPVQLYCLFVSRRKRCGMVAVHRNGAWDSACACAGSGFRVAVLIVTQAHYTSRVDHDRTAYSCKGTVR